MNKKISALLLAGVMVLSLAACGSQGSTSSSSSTPSGGQTVGLTEAFAEAPILVTSGGQSADYQMVGTLMGKVGMEYEINNLATSADLGAAKTLIVVVGGSSKGLGAAGISQDDELARAQAIVDACEANDITVIVAHLGGTARRGSLSDMFNDLALPCADYILMVEDGNKKDSKFTDAAADMGVPITLINSIADAVGPLTDVFGA